jgi:hypothetical protein
MAEKRVQLDSDKYYQVAYAATDNATSPAVQDIADIALQQLMDTL